MTGNDMPRFRAPVGCDVATRSVGDVRNLRPLSPSVGTLPQRWSKHPQERSSGPHVVTGANIRDSGHFTPTDPSILSPEEDGRALVAVRAHFTEERQSLHR